MKKILFYVIVLLCSTKIFSQESDSLSTYQKVLYTKNSIQVLPEFRGGSQKLEEFIRSNFKNPKTKKATLLSVSFIVEMDGSVSTVVITQNDEFDSAKELKRIFEKSPKWLQGEHEGYHVRTQLYYDFVY